MATPPVRRQFDLPLEIDWSRIKWIYDPAPEWIWKDAEKFKRYVDMEAQFALRQNELEQQALVLEKERIQATMEFYK